MPEATARPRILIVEDDAILATHLQMLVSQLGYDPTGIAATGDDAVQLALQRHPDAILMDVHLRGGVNGIEATALIRQQADIPVVYLTAYTDEALLQQAKVNDAYAYLAKPVRDRELRASLEMALYKHETERRLAHLNRVLRAIREINQLITRAHDPQHLRQEACEILLRARGYTVAWITEYVDGKTRLLACAGLGADLVNVLQAALERDLEGKFPTAAATRVGQVVVHQDLRTEDAFAPWRAQIDFAQVTRSASIPMMHGGETFGVLSVFAGDTSVFDDGEIDLLEELAGDLAFSLKSIKEGQARQQAQQNLRLSEELYRVLLESLDSVVAMVDMEGRFVYVNEAAAQQLGLTPAQVVGKQIRDVFPEPVASRQLASIRRVMAADHGETIDNMSIVNGQPRWYRTSIQPIHDETGRVVQAMVNSTDFTALKVSQAELEILNRTLEERVRQRTAEVEDLYNNAPCGYHSLDAEGVFIHVNATELNWLGRERAEVIGHSFAEVLTDAGRAAFFESFPAFKQSGSISDFELDLVRKDGVRLPVLLSAVAMYNAAGEFVMSRSTVYDIAERKRAEQALYDSEARLRQNRDELSAANAALERAARMKDEFLASMSHELRTPLTGILGLSEALQYNIYGELNEKQLRALRNIESSGRHLLELINDILDLSKIEAGKLDVRFELSSLADICQASLQLTKGLAGQKRQSVRFSMQPEHIALVADGRRLKQILVNLLSNAVKFTPEGGVLGLEATGDVDLQQVRLKVWDKGIGIKPEDFDKLFRPFVQLDSSLSRQYQGTGLGLSLVQRMVEMHGGSVQLESEPGNGSAFTVILPWQGQSTQLPVAEQAPFDEASQAASAQAWTGAAPLAHVMVTDDHQIIVDTIADFLRARNYRVSVAYNGAQLLERIGELHPDILLLDVQMPGLDGLETTRRIRAHADPAVAATPVVALTALVMPNDRERCLAAGVNRYLSKPVYLPDVVKMIEQLLDEREKRNV